jgi:hypothetical protein
LIADEELEARHVVGTNKTSSEMTSFDVVMALMNDHQGAIPMVLELGAVRQQVEHEVAWLKVVLRCFSLVTTPGLHYLGVGRRDNLVDKLEVGVNELEKGRRREVLRQFRG